MLGLMFKNYEAIFAAESFCPRLCGCNETDIAGRNLSSDQNGPRQISATVPPTLAAGGNSNSPIPAAPRHPPGMPRENHTRTTTHNPRSSRPRRQIAATLVAPRPNPSAPARRDQFRPQPPAAPPPADTAHEIPSCRPASRLRSKQRVAPPSESRHGINSHRHFDRRSKPAPQQLHEICRIWTICFVEDRMKDARHSHGSRRNRRSPRHASTATCRWASSGGKSFDHLRQFHLRL